MRTIDTQGDIFMQTHIYDISAPKKPVNLSANSDLIKTAKTFDVDLSQVFEEAVLTTVKSRLEQKWLEENQEAIQIYNSHIEKHGVFATDKRRF
jgi:antitoxin CcdA